MQKIKNYIKTNIINIKIKRFFSKFGLKQKYINYFTDKKLLYPIVYKLEFLHTSFNLSPNDITLINMIFISPLIIYTWLSNHFLYSTLLLYTRNLLDGIDGHIARKYNLQSKEGEIYDHFADCIFSGLYVIVLGEKLSFNLQLTLFLSQLLMIFGLLIDFSPKFKWISRISVGAGGYDTGFCTLINIFMHLSVIASSLY